MIFNKIFFSGVFFIFLWTAECPKEFIELNEGCYYKNHIDVLQDFIDINKSLKDLEPQNIGTQGWEEGKLRYLYLGDHLITFLPDSIGLLSNLDHLDLQKNQLITIPEGICNLYYYQTDINVTDNNICPPYPECFEYISHQNTAGCEYFKCPNGYMEIEGECYKEEHIKVLQTIIENNESLHNLTPLDLGQEIGYQVWENGKLIVLNLVSNELTKLPEEICNIYPELKSFDVSNNAICPPYPSCFEYLGYQNNMACKQPSPCSEGYISIDNKCYFNKDIEVLLDFIKANLEIKNQQPLMLGDQEWKGNRLKLLNLDGLKIANIPESIHYLDSLEYLNLNNNKLEILPETLCKIYSNLIWVDLTNNRLCPPYISCFDYIGQQDIEDCHNEFCPLGYNEYDEECYYEKDLKVLQDFIDNNASLSGRKPLEIGVQKWKDMRLDFLYLGVNELTVIPESICEIYTNLSSINISRNNICPPYPACIAGIVMDQDTSNCR